MKKKIIIKIIVFLILVTGFTVFKFVGPAVSTSNGEFFYIKTGATYADVKKELVDEKYIKNERWFNFTSKILGYKTAKPGRYKIKNGSSLVSLVRMLKNGTQTPVSFVIIKIRTKEALAAKTGSLFECDSLEMIHFLDDPDSLKNYGLDTNTVMAALLPFTYTIKWNITPGKIFQQFYTAYKTFWTAERKQKADSLHLTPIQVSILASVIEEETRKKDDKPNIASVYLNRIKKNMPLQADPTVKFAMKNFGLKRILKVHLKTVSPYNTYIHTGLPPGPICTPSIETIDAVLNAPQTNYLYFVASSNFDGSSVFTTNITDHIKYAREYQQALNKLDTLKGGNK
jgi:UPF0755 protein